MTETPGTPDPAWPAEPAVPATPVDSPTVADSIPIEQVVSDLCEPAPAPAADPVSQPSPAVTDPAATGVPPVDAPVPAETAAPVDVPTPETAAPADPAVRPVDPVTGLAPDGPVDEAGLPTDAIPVDPAPADPAPSDPAPAPAVIESQPPAGTPLTPGDDGQLLLPDGTVHTGPVVESDEDGSPVTAINPTIVDETSVVHTVDAPVDPDAPDPTDDAKTVALAAVSRLVAEGACPDWFVDGVSPWLEENAPQ